MGNILCKKKYEEIDEIDEEKLKSIYDLNKFCRMCNKEYDIVKYYEHINLCKKKFNDTNVF